MRDVQGASGAGKIWRAFMEEALAGTEHRSFHVPAEVVEVEVCALSGLLPTPDCTRRAREKFAPTNLPRRLDDLHRRVEVCKVNGKLAFDGVPANARESRVFVVLPAPYAEWGYQNGYPAPPTQRCDDVYRGLRIAQIERPLPETPVSGVVQITGSAMVDDFHHLDLDVGAGAAPSQWSRLTGARTQSVDRALLGTWDTTGLSPGRYTLRLTVTDSFGNAIERMSPVVLAPPVLLPVVASPAANATPQSIFVAPRGPAPAPAKPAATPTPAPLFDPAPPAPLRR
jgi:hypothetical protein